MSSDMNETFFPEIKDKSEPNDLSKKSQELDDKNGANNESNLEKSNHDSNDESIERLDREIIKTPNSELADFRHPITDVPFKRDVLRSPDGVEKEGVFPEFECFAEYQLPDNLIEASDTKQFNYLNNELKKSIKEDLELAKKFNKEQKDQIENDDKPDGFTWHHHQQLGIMQLVKSVPHAKTSHEGKKHWNFQRQSKK